MTDAATIAATYFDAWKARDFTRLRSVLADDVDFAGPLARVRGGDDCLRGLPTRFGTAVFRRRCCGRAVWRSG
jgi:hypothetical protein